MTATSNKVCSATWSYDGGADKLTLTSADQIASVSWVGSALVFITKQPLQPNDGIELGGGQSSNAPGNVGVTLRAKITGPNAITVYPETATGACKAGGSLYVTRPDTTIAIDVAGGPAPPAPVPSTGATGVILRNGAPTAPPFYATAAEVAALITAASGDLNVEIDSSIVSPCVWDVDVDGKQRLTFEGARFNSAGPASPSNLLIAAGHTIKNLRGVTGGLRIEGDATTAPSIDQEGGAALFVSNGAAVANGPASTRPAVRQVAGGIFSADRGNIALNVNGKPFAVVEVAGVGQQSIAIVTNQTPGTPPPDYSNAWSTTDTTAHFVWLHDSSGENLPFLPNFAGSIDAAIMLEDASGTQYDDRAHLPSIEAGLATTAPFNTPAAWADVAIALTSSQGFDTGDGLAVAGVSYRVKTIVDPTHVLATLIPNPGNPPTGTLVPPGPAAHIQISVQNAIDVLKGAAVFARGFVSGPSGAPYTNGANAFSPILTIPIDAPIGGFLTVRAVVNASTQGVPDASGSGAAFAVSLDGGPHFAPFGQAPSSTPTPTAGNASLLARIPITAGAHTLTLDGRYLGTVAPGDGVTVGLQLAAVEYEITPS